MQAPGPQNECRACQQEQVDWKRTSDVQLQQPRLHRGRGPVPSRAARPRLVAPPGGRAGRAARRTQPRDLPSGLDAARHARALPARVSGLSPVRPLAAVPELSVVGATILAMASITPDSPFVGRARELARLEHLLEQAVAGSATGVLVAGDAGVGKTRLTTELLRWAQERGVVAVAGHCVDLGAGGLPYLPFAEALTGIARAGDLMDADDVARAAAGAVRSVVAEHPVLYRVTGRIEQSAADDGGDRMPLYEAVLGSIHAVTDGGAPMPLLLEDLHWADAATRDLLRFVLSRLSDERLLVV